MAIQTKITVQQMMMKESGGYRVGKYPRYIITLGNSLSSVTVEELATAVANANSAANAAAASQTAAKASETAAKTSETNSKASENAAKASQTAAAASQTAAKASETAAKTSETNSKTSENAAKASQTAAKTSETNAATSAQTALDALQGIKDAQDQSPFPDVWLPLNDSLQLLAGFAPYDRIYFGNQFAELTTKSATFTRSTMATYIDKSGILQTADINEPRFEKEGLLIEGQGTNLVPNSQLASTWRVANTTVTQASITSPDGSTNGVTRLASTGGTNVPTGSAISVPISGLSVGSYCSFSVFAKADSHNLIQLRWLGGAAGVSNRYLNVDLSTGEMGANNLFYAKTIPMANGWWRIIAVTSIDGDLTGNSSADPGVELISSLTDGRRPAVSLASGVGVYLYGPQLEPGLSSSYIQTLGSAATRAADDCTLQRSGNDNYFGPVTITAEVHCNGKTLPINSADARRGIFSYYPSAGEYVFAMVNPHLTTPGRVAFCFGSAALGSGNISIDDDNTHNIALVTDTINTRLSTDGNMTNPLAVNRPTPGALYASNQAIYIGRGAGVFASGARMLNGHIRNLRIWHRALTDNQIKGLK